MNPSSRSPDMEVPPWVRRRLSGPRLSLQLEAVTTRWIISSPLAGEGNHGRVTRRRAMRRLVIRSVLLVTLGVLLAPLAAAQSGPKTLRFIPQADLRILDPVWSSAYIT